jgi:hypothetical protein
MENTEITIKIEGIGTKCPLCGKGLRNRGINIAVGIAEDGELLPCKPQGMTSTKAELVTPYNGKVKFALVGRTCSDRLYSQGFSSDAASAEKSVTKFYKKF